MTGKLNDKEYLFTILMSIVKKNNGKYSIHEEDLLQVDGSEGLALLYNERTKEIVLKVQDAANTKALKEVKEQKAADKEKEKFDNLELSSILSKSYKIREDN